MGYNRYQWWKKGVKRKRPLDKNAPLLNRIQNGDFDYPVEYLSALDNVHKEIDDIKRKILTESRDRSQFEIQTLIREECRMKTVRKIKLELDLMDKEAIILSQLKRELTSVFGIDLWEDLEKGLVEVDSLENLYYLYRERSVQC
jgi:hypothetical protein